MWKFATFALLATLAGARAAPMEAEEDSSLKIVSRLFNDCGKEEDMSVCLKLKAVNFLDRLGRTNGSIPVTDYVAIADVPYAKDTHSGDEQSERELEVSLKQARSLDEKSATLDELMWNKLFKLFRTKTLQLSVPTDVFEGRGKKGGGKGKKHHGMMMMMMMAGMMMKMMIWKVGMMAGKAMMVGKAAMIMAIVMMLKKMGGGGGGESHPPVVYAAEQGGGGWQRRYTDAQNMAYATHNPGDY